MLMFYLQLIETEEDRQLFTLLYESHRKQMHYVANMVLRNDSLSEDAVHNAFVGIANNMDALHNRSKEDMRNYLLKAAQNAAINLSKREKKQEDYCVNLDDEQVEDSVLEALSEKLNRETIVDAIMQISEPYNTVLYCHFVMEMEHKEIASVLQRKPDAVRKQLSRGRKMLQALLKEALEVHV